MGEAFITRRGGNISVYDATNAVVTLVDGVYSEGESDTIILSGLGLPKNIKAFSVFLDGVSNRFTSGGGGTYNRQVGFTLIEDGVSTASFTDDDDEYIDYTCNCIYSVLDGDLYLTPCDDKFRFDFYRPTILNGIIVC